MYNYDYKLSKGNKSYRCCYPFCKGWGQVDIASDQFSRTKEHNHAADYDAIEYRKTTMQLKEAVYANPTSTLKEVYDAVTTRRKSDLRAQMNAKNVPGYPVVSGIFKEEAIDLLKRFYTLENKNGFSFLNKKF